MENKMHSKSCRYRDNDKMQYAYLKIEEKFILILAYEFELFDSYLEKAIEDDKNIKINYEQSDNEPYQIVYGAMMFDEIHHTYSDIVALAKRMEGYAFLDLELEKVNVSGYQEILFFPEEALAEEFIPFVALMQTPHHLQRMKYSITMFPALENHLIWESMVNRPFLLACRESIMMEGLSEDNWTKYIEKNKLMQAYKIADLVVE